MDGSIMVWPSVLQMTVVFLAKVSNSSIKKVERKSESTHFAVRVSFLKIKWRLSIHLFNQYPLIIYSWC